jgi:multidrug transporter EmrE-like cation transporter
MEKMKPYTRATFWIPLIIATAVYGIGDVLLKMGNMDIGSTFERLLEGEFWLALIQSGPIIVAFAASLLAKLIMGLVLSRNPLGISEGFFLAFSVIIVFVLGIIFFAESVDYLNIVGLIVIVVGIILVYFPVSAKEEEAAQEVVKDE